jgi:serine/threonine protein kinase/formylglycine-generating enzyme required for sulfatase activity
MHDETSLGGDATFAGQAERQRADVSLGGEQTLGGDLSGQNTIIDDLEIVDLEARYTLEGTLGQGGMGAVLLATDTRLDRKVAIKRILGESAESRTAVSRFLTEAKAIAALNHPNIVQIYDYGRAKDGPFLIMEYVDGGSLLDRCRASALSLDETVSLACQLCDGLAKAHDLCIVHRDIKPANVLLTKDGTPKLTDFGLAKAESSDHGQTMAGAVLGTPDFMPPEQRMDASLVDARSDLWSLAATVYQMATGRSPKIIRFDLLPPGLIDVLGKALEDEKESRYQTAREFRDALRASLAKATTVAADLVEGQCPSCGVNNDSSRRFCRGCGESLQAPCLSCAKPMPMWESICGQCGTKQMPLVEKRHEELNVLQAEAESRLKDHDFDASERITVALRDEADPRFKQLVPWASEFLTRLGKARDAQLAEAGARLSDAIRHEDSFDYASAVHALEQVPEILRSRVLAGHPKTVAATLARVAGKQAELERLERTVKGRVAARELSGLLPQVSRLLELRPDRADLQKLYGQLEDRQRKLVAQRDEAVATARSHIEANEYELALADLHDIDPSVENSQVAEIRKQAGHAIDRLQGLMQQIGQAVAEKQFDGLIGKVELALGLKPGHAEFTKLLEDLHDREARIAAEIEELVLEGTSAFRAGKFERAAATLKKIPQGKRSDEVVEQLRRSAHLANSRSELVSAFSPLRQVASIAVAEAAELAGLASRGRSYLAEIATHGLVDAGIEECCRSFEAAVEKRVAAEKEALEAQRKRRRNRIGFALAAAALLLLVGGVCSWFVWRASVIRSAVASGDWQMALMFDPNNTEAHIGLARSKLNAQPPDINGAFAELELVVPHDQTSAEVQSLRAAAHAVRVDEHIRAGRLDDAGKELEEARRYVRDGGALRNVTDNLAQAWLTRAKTAARARSATKVRAAAELARRYGAAESALKPVLAEAMLLDAIELMSRGDMASVAKKVREALGVDPATVKSGLEDPANSRLRRTAVLSSLPVEFLNQLSPQVYAGLSPSEMESLPPSLFAKYPPIQNSIGMRLKLVPAGTFRMGSEVTLTKPFYVGVCEVTNSQWRQVMGSVPSKWKYDDLPVEQVSWDDAVDFCRRLSEIPEELKAGRAYRLPTAAEWEYACRAGTATKYAFGDDESQLAVHAWSNGNAGDQTHPVGRKGPNQWELFDMHGNVSEWCSDWHGDAPDGPVTDPQGPPEGSRRVLRGGGWGDVARFCQSASRSWLDPTAQSHDVGFRVVMTLSGSNSEAGGP